MKKCRYKDFECNVSDSLCGKLRVIDFDSDLLEICWLPPKRPERNKKCVVINKTKLLRFLRKTYE